MTSETPERTNGEEPAKPGKPEPTRPRKPSPVDEPIDPHGPGSEPDYFPDKPGPGDLPKMDEPARRNVLLTASDSVCAALACATAVR